QVILIGELYGVFHRCDAWSGHLRIVRGGIVSEGRNFVLARDEVHDASRIRFRVSTQKCVVVAEVESVVSEVTPEVVMVAAVGTRVKSLLFEKIVPLAAVERVVPVTVAKPSEGVVAKVAVDNIVPRAAIYEIVALATVQRVLTIIAKQLVVAEI